MKTIVLITILIVSAEAYAMTIQLTPVANGSIRLEDNIINSGIMVNSQFDNPDVEQIGFVEFDISKVSSASIGNAQFSFSVKALNSLAKIKASAYIGDGIIFPSNFSFAGTPLGEMTFDISSFENGNRFSFDISGALKKSLITNSNYIGIRLEALSNVTHEYSSLQIVNKENGDSLFPTITIFDDPQPQTIYIDFGHSNVNFKYGSKTINWTSPDFSGTASDRNEVVTEVKSLLSGYNVNVVTTKPTKGNFSTIYVGGISFDDILGIAENIDYFNSNQNDNALVFSDSISSNKEIAEVLVHEVGHLLGLRHILDFDQLMFPYLDISSPKDGFGGPSFLSFTDPDIRLLTLVKQDSNNELGRNVGFSDGSDPTGTTYVNGLIKKLKLVFSDLAASLYDVEIGFMSRYEDAGPSMLEIPFVSENSEIELWIPLLESDKMIFSASSMKGGVRDIFVIDEGTSDNGFFSDLTRVTLEELLVPLGNPTWSIEKFDMFGERTLYGSVSLQEISTSAPIPEPASLALLGLGLAGLCVSRRKVQQP